ncbi:MAG TPA: hypothetical protein PKJ63_13285 [Cyclobacteriaceae bacterium]|nr:hypothetical protein [Cyclobacteriaceae bacterium]
MKPFVELQTSQAPRESTCCNYHPPYRIPHPPADRPTGLTLKSKGGPCPSLASWAAPPLPASARFNVADLGGIGFGSFCQTKGPRLPGRDPATQNITWIRELETHIQCVHPPAYFIW